MAVQAWTNMSILVGASELAGLGRNVTMVGNVDPLDATNYQSGGWTKMVGGRKSAALSVEFMQDMADDGADETLWALVGSADVPHALVAGSTVGSVAYLTRGVPTQYVPISGEAGTLAMASQTVNSSGVIARGALLHSSTTSETTSSTATAVQLGAVTSGQRMYASLHVISGTGGTLTVKVQSDNASNFPSATDRITFTATTGRTYEWSSVAGAVTDDYWRAQWTITGGTWLFAVTAGIF